MRKMVEQILEGKFDYESGSLSFSCDKLELLLKKEQQYEGSFCIYAPQGLLTEGTVISSDWRMDCLTNQFSGSEAEIFFRFHGEMLEEGDVVKGCFYVISNHGEYYLPFVVTVEYSVLDSSMGSIKSLSQFAALAKEHWQEACDLFYSPGFVCVFSGDDDRYREAYRALTDLRDRGPSTDTGNAMEARHSVAEEHSMEEFLFQTGKKQKMEFLVEEGGIFLEMEAMGANYGVVEHELVIARNGWGFTRLSIECKGDFFFTEKSILTEEDFVDNRCRLPVFLDTNLCVKGRHYGRLCLHHSYGVIVIPVEVGAASGNPVKNQEPGEKRYMVQLMKLYQAFRLRKMETSQWLKETGRLVEALAAVNENNIAARLFQAQLMITEGRVDEAGWILDYVSELYERKYPGDVLYAYYLYLTTLIQADAAYIGQVAGKVERIYRRDISNWRVAWLLLYLSEEYQRSDRSRWQLLEQLFATGCTSPVLYIEVLNLLNSNPALLRKLGGFEQQVIYYGLKHGFLRHEVAEQVCYLADRVKEYSEVLLKILEELYIKMDAKPSMKRRRMEGKPSGKYSAVSEEGGREADGQSQGGMYTREADGQSQGGMYTREADGQSQGGMYTREADGQSQGGMSSQEAGNLPGEEMQSQWETYTREAGYLRQEEASLERTLLLQEICTLLIKKGRIGSKYFGWYEEGVKAQLRITNLYEYYLMSMNIEEMDFRERMYSGAGGAAAGETGEIPKTVLMYFSYQNRMDYVRNAYLYDYMLQRQEQLGETYNTYRPKIEQFIIEQIHKGHTDRHLANLYQKLLRPEMLDEQSGASFSRLLFAHLIQVEDARLKKVYVYQRGNLQPAEYALTEGRTWVSLYGSHYTIVFEDAWGKRFLKNEEYTIEKLMIPGKFLRWLLPMDTRNLELDFYMCEEDCIYKGIFHEGIERGLRVVESGAADSRVKAEISLRILQYFYDTEQMRGLDQYLENLPTEEFTAAQRGEVIKFMVLRRKYELAGLWLEKYGPYIIEAGILAQLLEPLMEKCSMARNPVLVAGAEHAFRKKKYSSTMLTYLAMHYQGMTRNLRHIWKAAMSYEVDCYELSERILWQMLYSGAFVGEKMEIFRYYVSRGAKTELETAFLSQCAYDYFVRERVMEQDVFLEIQQSFLRGEPVQKICKLAYLKYAADSTDEMDEAGVAMRNTFLAELLEEGIRLDFFKCFRDCEIIQQELADKTILEYHTTPRIRARIHYVIPGEDGGADGYMAEYMKEAYPGVFFKEFVLFFGENLQYYITEEQDGQEQLTESGTLQKNDRYMAEGGGRYELLNDIAARKSLQEYVVMDHLLEEYYRKDFVNGRLFELR